MTVEQASLTSPDFRPEEGAFFDLSSRTKLRITGSDRTRYLNGQITNDVRKASDGNAIHGCILSAKGKIDADVFVTVEGDAFLVDADPSLTDALTARLDRYIIADDVQLEDATEEFAFWHVLGVDEERLSSIGKCRKTERFGMIGIDLWLPRAEHEKGLQALSRLVPICDEECAEMFRIERGLPRWGHELTDAIIPTEANLEASAIDFAKGCYIGQEVISRIKMSGQTNKRLCGFVVIGEKPAREGMRLMAPGQEGKEIGWLTSVTWSRRLDRQIALGFAKRGYQEIGSSFTAQAADGEQSTLQIAALPFV